MSKIDRFECVAVYNEPGYTTAAMKPSDSGDYVSYASHQAEMQRLQREIDALKQAQKSIVFERVSSVIGKSVDSLISDIAKQVSMTAYKVNPELWRTAPAKLAEMMVDEKCKSAGLIMVDECMKDPVISMHHASIDDKPSLDPGVGLNSRCIMFDVEKAARHVANNVTPKTSVRCIKSNCNYFTPGKDYDCEFTDGVVVVVQDDFVSGFHDGWELENRGAYYMMENSYNGGIDQVIFKP